MAAEGNNVVLEHLCAIRAGIGKIERELGDVRHRVSSMERHLANLQSEVANIHLRLDHQGERLARTEPRRPAAERYHRGAHGARRGTRRRRPRPGEGRPARVDRVLSPLYRFHDLSRRPLRCYSAALAACKAVAA